MGAIESKVKRWGNSLGLIIPSDAVETEKIKENQTIRFIILKDSSKVFKDTFGMLGRKLKKTGQQLKDELRREPYYD